MVLAWMYQQSTETKFAKKTIPSDKELLREQGFFDGIAGPKRELSGAVALPRPCRRNTYKTWLLQTRRHGCLIDIEDYLKDDSTGGRPVSLIHGNIS